MLRSTIFYTLSLLVFQFYIFKIAYYFGLILFLLFMEIKRFRQQVLVVQILPIL